MLGKDVVAAWLAASGVGKWEGGCELGLGWVSAGYVPWAV